MEFVIQRVQPGDELLALESIRSLIPEDERDGREPTLQYLQLVLSQDTNYLILALVGGKPVGFLTAYRMPSFRCDAFMVYLFEIEVAVGFRQQGIGKQMIQLLKRLCRDVGVEDIWVGTEKDNIAARRLYESTGGMLSYPDNCEYTYTL